MTLRDLLRLGETANISRVFHWCSELGIYELIIKLMQI
jgi:hypothetical protein